MNTWGLKIYKWNSFFKGSEKWNPSQKFAKYLFPFHGSNLYFQVLGLLAVGARALPAPESSAVGDAAAGAVAVGDADAAAAALAEPDPEADPESDPGYLYNPLGYGYGTGM